MKLDDAQWVKLEAQVLRAWARQARADSQALIARSQQARTAISAQRAQALA